MKQRVEAKSKTLIHMDKNRKELWSRVDLITEKVNRLGNKYDKEEGEEGKNEGLNTRSLVNWKDKEGETYEDFSRVSSHRKRDREGEKGISF